MRIYKIAAVLALTAAPAWGQTITPSAGSLPSGTNTIGGVTSAISPGSLKAFNVTTAATAGTSSTLIAASTVTRGFEFRNEGSTTCFWSNAVAAGTTLTASNAQQITAGSSFTTPSWWAPSGQPLTAAATTTTACVLSGQYL